MGWLSSSATRGHSLQKKERNTLTFVIKIQSLILAKLYLIFTKEIKTECERLFSDYFLLLCVTHSNTYLWSYILTLPDQTHLIDTLS